MPRTLAAGYHAFDRSAHHMIKKRDPYHGATPANWAGSAGSRPATRTRTTSGATIALIAVFAIVAGSVAGYAFGADQHIRDEVLSQRTELRASPMWVSLDTLPAHVPAIFLMVTDPAFERRGRIVHVGDETTLGRDLVRQMYGLRNTPGDRAREMIYAPVLESRLSRRNLLEFYLNRVLMGVDGEARIFGIGDASWYYLDKSAAELTIAETAALAGLLLRPRLRAPAEVPGSVGARRNEVLREMVSREMIDIETYQAATREALPFQPGLQWEPMAPPPSEEDDEVIRLERPAPPPVAE